MAHAMHPFFLPANYALVHSHTPFTIHAQFIFSFPLLPPSPLTIHDVCSHAPILCSCAVRILLFYAGTQKDGQVQSSL